MRVKKLKIKNIRKITDAELEFNKPLIILYGQIQEGKTTFLDTIKILFTAGFPSDLIQHGKEEAEIELILENGIISRSFYANKEGQIIGRPLNAIVDNKKLSSKDLQRLFNPFQLNQDFLKEMSAPERKRFFVNLFNIDTLDIDNKISIKEVAAKDLRGEVKGIGIIEPVKVDKPNIKALQKEEADIREALNKKYLENKKQNEGLKGQFDKDKDSIGAAIELWEQEQEVCRLDIENTKLCFRQLEAISKGRHDIQNIYKAFSSILPTPKEKHSYEYPKEPEYIPEIPDQKKLIDIQERMSDSKANKILYDNYLKEVERQNEKEKKVKKLKEFEIELNLLRKEKIGKLAEYGKEVKGLAFNKDGDLTFENITNDNLSTSQVVRLGSELSKLYPDSLLDLELLDRGESLGESIYNFIDKAKTENSTILATVVGVAPAKLPDDIGVFIVKDGNLIR